MLFAERWSAISVRVILIDFRETVSKMCEENNRNLLSTNADATMLMFGAQFVSQKAAACEFWKTQTKNVKFAQFSTLIIDVVPLTKRQWSNVILFCMYRVSLNVLSMTYNGAELSCRRTDRVNRLKVQYEAFRLFEVSKCPENWENRERWSANFWCCIIGDEEPYLWTCRCVNDTLWLKEAPSWTKTAENNEHIPFVPFATLKTELWKLIWHQTLLNFDNFTSLIENKAFMIKSGRIPS